MTRSMDIARELRNLSARLKRAAVWNGSGLHVDATTQPYMFELMCFFRLAVEAHGSFAVRVEGKTSGFASRPKAHWPRSPGSKANFSYLSLRGTNNRELHQLCAGINVLDMFSKQRAPDITLLRAGTGDLPTHQDIEACWDAKHTDNPKKRLPDAQVADFAVTFGSFAKPRPPSIWQAALPSRWFKQSGLLTNGIQSTEPASFLAHHGIQETSVFPLAPTVRP